MTDEQPTPDLFRVGDENMCAGELTLSSDCHPIYDDNGLIVGITFDKNYARRIVACVNACTGIETSSLEAINKHGVTLRQKLAGAQDQMIGLEQQRDELLAERARLVAEASEWMRERCAVAGHGYVNSIWPNSLLADNTMAAIRALPGVTLEDIKNG